MRNSGNCIYDYAHSFFEEDFNQTRYTGLIYECTRFCFLQKTVQLLVITTLIIVDFPSLSLSIDISLTPVTQLLKGETRCIEIFYNFNRTSNNSTSLLLTLIMKYSNKRLRIRSLIQVKYQWVKFIFMFTIKH